VWLRPYTLSRLRHFQTVCSEIPQRSATIQAGSPLAWIAALILGVVVAVNGKAKVSQRAVQNVATLVAW